MELTPAAIISLDIRIIFQLRLKQHKDRTKSFWWCYHQRLSPLELVCHCLLLFHARGRPPFQIGSAAEHNDNHVHFKAKSEIAELIFQRYHFPYTRWASWIFYDVKKALAAFGAVELARNSSRDLMEHELTGCKSCFVLKLHRALE